MGKKALGRELTGAEKVIINNIKENGLQRIKSAGSKEAVAHHANEALEDLRRYFTELGAVFTVHNPIVTRGKR